MTAGYGHAAALAGSTPAHIERLCSACGSSFLVGGGRKNSDLRVLCPKCIVAVSPRLARGIATRDVRVAADRERPS